MDQVDLCNVLKTTGLRIAYDHYVVDENNPPPTPPYLAYLTPFSNNFGADNKVYVKSNAYQIELYTIKKDLASEKLVEDALDLAEIFYDKSETYIDSEKLYQVVYEIEI